MSVCRHTFSNGYSSYTYVRFAQNLALIIYMPICKNCGTNLGNFDF